MVADSLWGSTPMNTLICAPVFVSRLTWTRGGHCYCELGSPLLRHASTRRSTGTQPENEPHPGRVGSRKESAPPTTWTESGRTPVLPESSSSRDCPDRG